jgi:hypothetical protein
VKKNESYFISKRPKHILWIQKIMNMMVLEFEEKDFLFEDWLDDFDEAKLLYFIVHGIEKKLILEKQEKEK